jgi:nitrogen-specific signal transduction histidine kinase
MNHRDSIRAMEDWSTRMGTTSAAKLNNLTNELRTPVEIIRGLAVLIKKGIDSNSLEPAELLREINTIAETADQIKELLDNVHKS